MRNINVEYSFLRLLAGSLEVLDGCFELGSSDEKVRYQNSRMVTTWYYTYYTNIVY